MKPALVLVLASIFVSIALLQRTNQSAEEPEDKIILERKKELQLKFGKVCLWCFSYSKKRTLDCLRRSIIERYFYLRRHMCLVKSIDTG